MSSGFLVTRPYRQSNVGSNLASMAGALWLARELDRTLVVDWRGLSQLGDDSLNYFSEFFETPGEIDGVRVLYAPADEAGAYGEDDPESRRVDLEDVYAIRKGRVPNAPRTLVVERYHGLDRIHPGPEAERFRLLRSFYRHIRPADVVARETESWWSAHCDGRFVVGVNVRTGNGRYFGKGQPYAARVDVSLFEDTQTFLRKLDAACRARVRGLPRPLRDSYCVFYATDSREMSELLSRLPRSVTRREVFPPPGSGDTYRFDGREYTDRDSIVDTLADMFLLGRCDALVYNSSMFNQYARVLNGHFGGNQVHIQSLYLRHRTRYVARAIERRLR